MALKRVVVTGLGALTPLGKTVSEYWQGLTDGVSGCDLIRQFDVTKFKTRFACEVKDFEPTNYLDRKEARKMDCYCQFALIASDEAVKDAGISKENVNPDRVGVIFASGIGGLITFQEEVINFASGDGTPRFNPFFIPKMILDIAAGQISMRHGFRGPNFAVVSACASSTNAIIDAFDNIRLNKADIVVTGGSEAVISAAGVGGFNAMKALSERNDDPKTASRPFDKDRDGFVMGEGSGVLILESLEHALARGAKIYCEIAGGGASAAQRERPAGERDGRLWRRVGGSARGVLRSAGRGVRQLRRALWRPGKAGRGGTGERTGPEVGAPSRGGRAGRLQQRPGAGLPAGEQLLHRRGRQLAVLDLGYAVVLGPERAAPGRRRRRGDPRAHRGRAPRRRPGAGLRVGPDR